MVTASDDLRLARCEKGFNITFGPEELKAFLLLDSKELGGKQVTAEDIVRNLNNAAINHGIDKEAIEKIAAEQILDKKHVVAVGTSPEAGIGARFELCFDPNRKVAPKEGSDGRIDYKNMDFLQSAEPGQVLIKKIPATQGAPGKTVTNKSIPPKPGKDKAIPRGANTELSADGLTLSAAKAGTIVYAGSVVSIQPMTTISGSVDLSTGNIVCRGSLKVAQDIKSDFKITVEGDLEVGGNVEDSEINCNGNVIVKGGFIGRGDGVINAKGDVTVKYVINQTINSSGNVYVGGEVVNAEINAWDEINVISSKGKAVGGVLTARNLIRATTIGADAGTSTILKVAYDAKLMEQLRTVINEIARLKGDGARVKQALVGLYKLKMSNLLPPQKEAVLTKLEEFKKGLPAQLQELETQQVELDKKIAEFKHSKVIAEKNVYPGVQVHIGRQYKELDTMRGPTIFELHTDSIIVSGFNKADFEARERVDKAKKQKDTKETPQRAVSAAR